MSEERPNPMAARVEDVLSRLPPDVRESLTEEQFAAFGEAIGASQPWRRHPIDIRIAFPLGGRRAFLTLIGGSDRRGDERLRQERQVHPLKTTGNMIFLGVAVVALYAIAGVIALLIGLAFKG